MTIAEKKVVTLSYELRLDNSEGEFIEKTSEESPLEFLFGAGSMLPAFEGHLLGKKLGDKFQFTLTSMEAYGELNKEAVVELPIETFMEDGKVNTDFLQLGKMVVLKDQEGHLLQGKVLHIGLEKVKMDFNHPLAGCNLHFSGAITGLRDATETEVSHGHVHGPGHEHH